MKKGQGRKKNSMKAVRKGRRKFLIEGKKGLPRKGRAFKERIKEGREAHAERK